MLTGMLTGVALTAPQALAATTQCTGFTACKASPYTDHGWGSNYTNGYWGQYSGHNCTNYVAYYEQAVKGMSGSRPSWLTTGGNADAWASEASAGDITVSNTPVVGAIAQWGDYGWNESSGHVGIVESVASNGASIVVSWDTYSAGPYKWVQLNSTDTNTSTAVGWPQHFIYLGVSSGNSGTSGWSGVGSSSYFGSDQLTSGGTLNANHYLLSQNAQYVLALQTDGNLVLYHGFSATWSSNTGGSGATHLSMQTDGNLVLYTASNTPVWYTTTGGNGASHLVIQTDGNLVLYRNSDNTVTWNSGTIAANSSTYFGSDQLINGGTLASSSYMKSSDGRYGLMLQTDGNLVLYGPGYHVLWSSSTSGSGATHLSMQTDGNLVLYTASNTPVWYTTTGGNGASHLVIQTDGNLVLYRNSDNTVTWSTGTVGQV